MSTKANEILMQLDTLLEKEREILLSGELGTLNDIVEQKETLIDTLNEMENIQPVDLAPVGEKVMRNKALLEQSLSGIRTVAKRLAEIREAKKAFDTYNSMGQKNRIESGAENSVEKHA